MKRPRKVKPNCCRTASLGRGCLGKAACVMDILPHRPVDGDVVNVASAEITPSEVELLTAVQIGP